MSLADGSTVSVSVNQSKNICNSKCQVINLCDVDTSSELKCEKGTVGCKDDCTLAGSSILASSPSFCGDGIVGMGEWGDCESDTGGDQGGNPVQVATSIGESEIINPLTK